jgi:hypothetical protein
MKMVTVGLCVLLSALATHGHALTSASSCESLSSLSLPNVSITLAQTVPAGTFALPGTGTAAPQFNQLPPFCVTATLTKIEVWLPVAIGTESSRPSATAAGRALSPTAGWPRGCRRVTQRHRRARDTQTPMRRS